MPANFQTVLEIALALPGVTQRPAYGTPALHVGRKLMARLREDGETLVVKVPLPERAGLIEAQPDVFYLTDHYLDYPAVLVRLEAVATDQLRRLLDGAWRVVASKRQIAARDAAPKP